MGDAKTQNKNLKRKIRKQRLTFATTTIT